MRYRTGYSVLKLLGEQSKKYANLPDRYIKRAMEQVYWEAPKDRRYLPTKIQRKEWFFSTHRAWSREFYMENLPGKKVEKVWVEPILHWSFFRGDRVEILVGRDKGKQGFVSQIFQERNWVTVLGLNTKIIPYGKSKDFPGIIVLEEMPLLVTTEVALVDPSDMQPTTIVWRYDDKGDHVRVSKRTGRVIPVPLSDGETIDYKSPEVYREQPKDTPKKAVEEITYKPVLKTFEMDIMDKMGIKEDRIPHKSYWY